MAARVVEAHIFCTALEPARRDGVDGRGLGIRRELQVGEVEVFGGVRGGGNEVDSTTTRLFPTCLIRIGHQFAAHAGDNVGQVPLRLLRGLEEEGQPGEQRRPLSPPGEGGVEVSSQCQEFKE